MTTATARADLSVIKARQQKTWASGDYAVVASRIVLVSELLADAADLQAGWKVLDVACGNGNATLAAARSGTHAIGIDYVPELLEGGRVRGGRRGPRRRVPARRHRRPARGGRVIRRGAFRFRGDVRARSPAGRERDHPGRPPRRHRRPGLVDPGRVHRPDVRCHHPARARTAGVASPLLWGTEQHLSDLFGAAVADAESVQRTCTWRFTSPEEFVSFFRRWYGPALKAFEVARRGRTRRAGRRPGPPGPPLGPEPRRQHRHPRDLPGNHPHPPLIHLACLVRVNGRRVPAQTARIQRLTPPAHAVR